MEGEWELVCDLSNGSISNDLEVAWTNPNPVFKVAPLFDAKYLTNRYRYGRNNRKGRGRSRCRTDNRANTILFADVLLQYNDAGSTPSRCWLRKHAVAIDWSLTSYNTAPTLCSRSRRRADSVDKSIVDKLSQPTSRLCLLRCLVTLHILICWLIT